jgi:hypothetical protein
MLVYHLLSMRPLSLSWSPFSEHVLLILFICVLFPYVSCWSFPYVSYFHICPVDPLHVCILSFLSAFSKDIIYYTIVYKGRGKCITARFFDIWIKHTQPNHLIVSTASEIVTYITSINSTSRTHSLSSFHLCWS